MNTEVGKSDSVNIMHVLHNTLFHRPWILLFVLFVSYPAAFWVSGILMPHLSFTILVMVRAVIIALPLVYISVKTVKSVGIDCKRSKIAWVILLQSYFSLIAALPIIIF